MFFERLALTTAFSLFKVKNSRFTKLCPSSKLQKHFSFASFLLIKINIIKAIKSKVKSKIRINLFNLKKKSNIKTNVNTIISYTTFTMTDTIVIDTTSKSSSTGGANVPVTNTSLNKYNFLNLLAYVVNASVTFGIGVDGKYRSILAPFGPSFIIWTVIFVWQAIWVLWQFLPSQRNSEGVERAWYYYPIMTFWQTVWTVSYLYDIMWLSLICMYFILITLVMTSMSLQKYSKTWKGYLLWQGPISINTGWIMAAAAVSTNSFAVAVEATATTQLILSSLSLVVLLGTAFTWLCSYPVDFAIPLVIVWALGGIYGELQNPSQIVLEEFTTRQINGVQSGVLAGLYLSSFGIIVKILYVLLKQRPDSMKKKIHEEEQKGSSVYVSAPSSASASASAASAAAAATSASASASASSSQEEEEEEAV